MEIAANYIVSMVDDFFDSKDGDQLIDERLTLIVIDVDVVGPITYMDKKIDYSKIYSPSKLNMFTSCPKSYQFYYLDPIYSPMKTDLKKLPQNIYSFFTLGKAVHNALTLFFHSPSEERTKDSLKDHLKETWRSEMMKNKKPPLGKWGGFATLEEERQSYGEALKMLNNFMDMFEEDFEIEYLPTADFYHSIKDYQDLITPLSRDFDISGKFDLVAREGDSLHIVDFKTSKREEENPFQLRFYKILAEEKFKKPVKKASFYFLKTGKKKEFDLEPEKKDKIKSEILDKIKKIVATESFGPQPSKLCQFCLYRTFCPLKDEVKKIVGDIKEEEFTDDLPF